MIRLFKASWQRTLCVMFIGELVASIGFSTVVPFLPLYIKGLDSKLNLSVELLVGLALAFPALTMMVASPLWGTVADKYGRKLMVARAMFGGSVVVLLIAFTTSAEALVLLRGVQGLTTGTLAAGNALVAAAVPRNRTGYAMALLQVAYGTGFTLGPLVGGLIADAFGYRAAFYTTAALLFIAGVLVWFGIREEFTPVVKPPGSRRGPMFAYGAILASPAVLAILGVRFVSQLGQTMTMPLTPLFIQSELLIPGRINSFIGLISAFVSATMAIGAISLGRLSDRVELRKIVIACALLAALAYFPQSLVTTGWQLMVLQGIAGFAVGGMVPALTALLAQQGPSGEEGAIYGLDNSITAGSRALAPMVGTAVALWIDLRSAFAAAGFVYIVAAVLAIWHLPRGAPHSSRLPVISRTDIGK